MDMSPIGALRSLDSQTPMDSRIASHKLHRQSLGLLIVGGRDRLCFGPDFLPRHLPQDSAERWRQFEKE